MRSAPGAGLGAYGPTDETSFPGFIGYSSTTTDISPDSNDESPGDNAPSPGVVKAMQLVQAAFDLNFAIWKAPTDALSAILNANTGILPGDGSIAASLPGVPLLGGLISIGEEAAEEVPATLQLARAIQGDVPLSAQTVVLLETRGGPTIVTASGAAGLNPQQVAFAQAAGLTPGVALGKGFDAEINGIFTAGQMGLLPTRGVATNSVCFSCSSQMSSWAAQGGFQLQLSNGGKSFTFVPPGQ